MFSCCPNSGDEKGREIKSGEELIEFWKSLVEKYKPEFSFIVWDSEDGSLTIISKNSAKGELIDRCVHPNSVLDRTPLTLPEVE